MAYTRAYTSQEIRYILNSYKTSNGSPREAQIQLTEKVSPPPSTPTIRKYWRKAGYKLHQHGGRRVGTNDRRYLSEKEVDLIIREYLKSGSILSTKKSTGHDWLTIKRYLMKKGLFNGPDLENRLTD